MPPPARFDLLVVGLLVGFDEDGVLVVDADVDDVEHDVELVGEPVLF